MKIKGRDKKSWSCIARSPVLIQGLPLRPVYEPQTATAGVCATEPKEQTGNVYENKGARQKVVELHSAVPRF